MKQDCLTRQALDKQVIIVPSSRVAKSLKCYAERIANKLDVLTTPAQLNDEILLGKVRWLSALIDAFARHSKEDFDAVERILNLERE